MSSVEVTPEVKAAASEEQDDDQKHQNGENETKADHSGDETSESQRRKHQRGGRKPKPSKSTQTSEAHKPWSERNGRLGPESDLDHHQPHDEIAEQDGDPNAQESTTENGLPKDFETGFKAFNLKRAQSSGGRRPFGLSVDRGESKEERSKKSKKKKKKKKKKKSKRTEEDSDEDEDSDSSSSSDEEPAERKPLSIRLDLNLELEIFLRAKVKGDITITFLE